MELLKFYGIPWNFCSRSGDSTEFHEIPWNLVLASSSMELSKFHWIPWNFPFDLVSSMEIHGISWNFWRVPWNSMENWNIDINEFHNWGSVFHCLLHDFMLLYIRQSISYWDISNPKHLFGAPHFAQMAIFHSKWRPVTNICLHGFP